MGRSFSWTWALPTVRFLTGNACPPRSPRSGGLARLRILPTKQSRSMSSGPRACRGLHSCAATISPFLMSQFSANSCSCSWLAPSPSFVPHSFYPSYTCWFVFFLKCFQLIFLTFPHCCLLLFPGTLLLLSQVARHSSFPSFL